MEDLLLNIIKESTGSKLLNIKTSAQEAYDLLVSQNNLLRSPSHELRTASFLPLKLALESKKSKFVSLALAGFNKIIRDERFQAGIEPEDDSLWLPAQLLSSTSSMLAHCEDTQVHILRVMLSLACSSSWALNGRLVMLLINRCGEAYEVGTQPVRAAAQAAASQTLMAFCTFLDEECQEILQQQQKHKNSGSSAEMVYTKTSAVACFNEAIPVMQYICSRLEEMKLIPKSNELTIFLLECLLTLVNTLPHTVHSNVHFSTFLWQKFCPALLSFLGAPGDPSGQYLTTNQSKIVYSIGIQVVRLVGRERALRPVLEALFHRMLLLPSPLKRLEPLKAARELLRSPGRLADLLLLSGPIHRHAGDDMAIIRLIMDSIEESSQCNDPNVLLASVECVDALLGSLESLCTGEGLDQEGSEIANSRYITLEQADYTGPLTYQSMERLPKPYRDVVANLKYQSDDDSSGIEGNIPDIPGTESDCSGSTEGPEEYGSQSEDSIMDDDSFLTNQQLQKLHKLPKSLNLGRSVVEECNRDVERQNARHFVRTLQNVLLPNLLSLRSSIQIDEVLQEFASKCCQHNSAQNFEKTSIMNADGIYLATYSALLLDLKLIQIGHFNENNKEASVPISEAQFVEEIHGSGVLVYVSATWLCELYQNVLAKSLMLIAGYNPNAQPQPAIVNLLTDVGGLCSSQLLTDWQKLQKIHGTPESSPEIDAGIKLSRRVLTCCWSSVVSVLGTPLVEKPHVNGTSALSRLVARRARQKHRQRVRDDIITASLEGLQKAASLSNTLKLQSRSSSILALLAASSCKTQGAKLLASHALSLDVLVTKGLALGSHSSACWPHIFNACVAIASLEHALFSKTGSTQLLMVAQNTQNNIVTSTTCSSVPERLNMSFNHNANDDEMCIDVYSFLQNNSYMGNNSNKQNATSIPEIIERSGVLNGPNQGTLRGVQAAKVCCVLSQKCDELFHSAAFRLSLPGLCSFLTELCKASHAQLFTNPEESLQKTNKWWKKELEIQKKPPTILLLHRVGEVTLKCIRSGRPLIHLMKVWAIVGPHFMQASCHKDRTVSKKAVACIHDAVTSLFNEQTELPHFHFNEALIKPFENLLCLELCDLDVQDQIVSCLCEFVEANRTEICSGWRTLFGTLRVANAKNNAAAILEVFRIFLSTDNTLVFANAALDYILCLLAHIRSPGPIEELAISEPLIKVTAEKKNIVFLDKDLDYSTKSGSIDICVESLTLLQNCVSILSMMYNMPKCPTFNLTHRMTIDTEPQVVDRIMQNMEYMSLQQEDELSVNVPHETLSTLNEMKLCEENRITLSKMDRPSGVLKIWYILLEGLSTAATNCANKNQALIVDTLFTLLRNLVINPGINFGFYCINHLLLPMVQNWLRQNMKLPNKTGEVWMNFKHCCGLATELVVDYMHYSIEQREKEMIEKSQKDQVYDNPAANLAFKQLLIILVEIGDQPYENLARLGTSCMRHIILSAGKILTAYQWEIFVVYIHRACTISLYPLQQLISAFKENSDSFYGDLSVVKVAARKDSTIEENKRIYELARQIFLMQAQRPSCNKCLGKLCDCDIPNGIAIDDRSYVFLLYSLDPAAILNSDLYATRVPFRRLVVGILAHEMLIQTISSALLQNLNHITPILNILQINTCSLRGILRNVNAKHVDIMLKCLEISNVRAQQFDQRPGLKFLTQKVGNLNKAANLYNQANTSEVVQIIVLIELCLDGIQKYNINPKELKMILAQDEKPNPSTDLEYMQQFLIKLQNKWETLCESYTRLTQDFTNKIENEKGMDEENCNTTKEINVNIARPLRVEDFKKDDDYLSTDSESYLEKDAIANDYNENDSVFDNPNTLSLSHTNSSENVSKPKHSETCASTDDETNEMAAKYTKQIYEKYKVELSSIKYDTNTILQMRKSAMSSDNIISPSHAKSEERSKSEGFDISSDIDSKLSDECKSKSNSVHSKVNPFVSSTYIPPPQPVLPEIQHQRSISIFKDSEDYKTARIETMEACLELLGSLSSDRLGPLASVLKDGAIMLVRTQDEKIKLSAEKLLQRMNISYIDYDNF